MLAGCLPAVPLRRRCLSDQEGVFITGAPETVQQEIVACLEEDLVQDVASSLDKTLADLKWDVSGHREDPSKVVYKTYADLSDFVSGVPPVAPDAKLSSDQVGVDGSGLAIDTKNCAGDGQISTMIGPLSRATTMLTEDNDDDADQEDLADPGLSPEHRAQAVFESHGLDFSQMQGVAAEFLRSIGLRPYEAGSRNFSKWRGRTLWNQCFYLSMSYAYLGHQASVRRIRGLARRLRRAIEAVVLEQHPSWAAGLQASTEGRGQAMVFADFLPLAMRTKDIPAEKNLLAKLCVCIMDSVNGHVEVYIGPGYRHLKDRSEQVKNLILLWYKPAHYQCLVRDDDDGSKLEYTYDEFKQLLVESGVVFIETIE